MVRPIQPQLPSHWAATTQAPPAFATAWAPVVARAWGSAWALILTAVVGGLMIKPVEAQFGNRANRAEALAQEQILLAPRPLTRLLREGQSAIQERRFSDGIEALGSLLVQEASEVAAENSLQQDYFTEPAGDGYYRTSVRAEALRLLGEIPEEGRQILEIKYGVTARQELQSAVGARDIQAISTISRKYYHTRAGYDANVLLAQDKLIRGFPIAAAGILQRLSEFPAARERFGPQLTSEVASAWLQAGRQDLAEKALQDGASRFPGASIMLGSRQVKLDANQEWPKLLSGIYPRQLLLGERALESWLMTGGQPDRNGTATAGLPMPMVAWDLPLHRDRSDEAAVANISRQNQSASALLPKLEARMLGDVVLAKTATANIFAIDLETGLRKWPFYKDSLPVAIAARPSSFVEAEEMLMQASLRNRIWGSSAFGQFTVDANQLYYITGGEDQTATRRTLNFQPMGMTPLTNMLIGVSLQGEGKEMWQVGGEESLSEPELAGAYFLGPPLSYEGELYTLAEINMETRLVVLDAHSGRLQWSQQLSLSPMAPIRYDMLRQSQALTPSIADSVLVCPVGNGAIIAVDLLTRSLKWAKQYAGQASLPPQFQLGGLPDPMDSYNAMEERWGEPQVVLHGGRVVFTPPETSRIMCLDLLTGATHWEQARDARYVAGIHRNQVIMVSNTDVHALNLKDGMATWGANVLLAAKLPNSNSPLRESGHDSGVHQRELVAGKSVRDGKYLYVPTTARRVLKIDLDEGKLIDAAMVEKPLGNLFAFKNRLISVGSSSICAYFTRDWLVEQVDQRLAANAKDIWALNQKALLLLSGGQVPEAIELLRQSFAIDSQNGETRHLLVDALLTGLENDFERYLPLASQYEEIIESQYSRFLILLAKGNIKNGQHEMAFNRLLQLVSERSQRRPPGLQLRAQTISPSAGHQVDIDTWIAVQLARVYQSAPPELQQRLLETVRQRLQSIAEKHPFTRELEMRYLIWIDAAHEATLNVAANLLGDVDQSLGERLLQPVLFNADEKLRDYALALLKQNTGMDNLAQLANSDEIVIGPDGLPMRRSPTIVAANVQWPRGMMQATVSRREAPMMVTPPKIKSTGTRFGRPEIELGLGSGQLVVSSSYGRPITQCLVDDNINELNDLYFLKAQVNGGLVFLETQGELFAFDIYRTSLSPLDGRLWRYSLARVAPSPRKSHVPPATTQATSPLGVKSFNRGGSSRESLVGPVTPTGIVVQKESDVILLDAMTGQPLWSRTGYEDDTALAAHELEVAVLRKKAQQVDVLDSRDGTLLRQYDLGGQWNTWFSSGPNVVQWIGKKVPTKRTGGIQLDTADADACELRVFNVFTGQVVATTQFTPYSKADSCDDRYLAVVETTGRLWYCDVATGQVAEHTLPAQPNLWRVSAQLFGERVVVWTSLPNSGISLKSDPDEREMARGVLPVNGSILALDATTGEQLWRTPGVLQRFTFNSSQPRYSPFMACYRIIQVGGARTANLVTLDLRDGTLAYVNNNLVLNNSAGEQSVFNMVIEPGDAKLFMGIGSTTVTLQATDEEKPPQPVCYYGAMPVPSRTNNRGFPFAPN